MREKTADERVEDWLVADCHVQPPAPRFAGKPRAAQDRNNSETRVQDQAAGARKSDWCERQVSRALLLVVRRESGQPPEQCSSGDAGNADTHADRGQIARAVRTGAQ